MNALVWVPCVSLVWLAACGGAAPPPVEAPKPGAPAAGDPAAPAEESAPAIPRAKIIEVLPGRESIDDRRVKIGFDNPTTTSCTFTSYTLVWPGGRKTIEEKPFEIPPGGTRQRKLIVHPNDGDLSTLKVEGSEVEVNAGCSPK
jgi:hypothetical protein